MKSAGILIGIYRGNFERYCISFRILYVSYRTRHALEGFKISFGIKQRHDYFVLTR